MLILNSLSRLRLRAFILPLLALFLLVAGAPSISAQSCDWEEEVYVSSNISGQVLRITGRGSTTLDGVGGGSGEVSYVTSGGGWNIIEIRLRIWDLGPTGSPTWRLIYDQPYSGQWSVNAASPPASSPLLNVEIYFVLDDGNEQTTASVSSGFNSACLPPPCQTINSFSASATTINLGQSVTFTTSTTNATSATITDLSTGQVYPVAVPNGTLTVSPASTRTYRLSAEGSCATVTQDITITVIQPPTISALSASPSSVCAGSSSTLSWSSSGGTSATITDLVSGSVTSVPVNGSLAVTPASTRTYRLSVTNGAGTVTQDAAVSVTPLAVINSYSASPTTINQGQSTTLSFNVSNTSSRSITDLTTGSVTSLGSESGSLVVTPASTRTYRLTATSGCNTITQDVTVTVNACQIITSFTASPAAIVQGQSTTLSWTSSNGTVASITDLSTGVNSGALPANGSLTVTPATTRTYRLFLNGPCAEITQDITVSVTACQTINSYSASSTNITAGQSVTLSWSTSGASAVYVYDVSTGTWTTHPPGDGSVVVTPATTRTYRLLVDGPCARITQDITITVTQCQTINSYSASATTINVGQSATLSWSTTGASAVYVYDVSTGTWTTHPPGNGSVVVTPASTRTYRLMVDGPCTRLTQDITITVVQPPAINTFAASVNPVCAGSSTTLSWTSTGATSASITDLTSGTVTSVGVNSSLSVAPASTRTYRLTVTNSAGSVTRDLAITVTPLVVINGFSASATTINQGQSTTLSFNVTNTTSRTITDLSTGTVTTLGTESGTLVVTPATTRTYRLTANGSCDGATREITITVNACQTITSFTATPSSIIQGQSTSLSWATTGATAASITDLATGINTAVPVNGSLSVNPSSTRTYRIFVNGPCAEITRDVTVTVTPCQTINSFTASATTINQGQSVAFSWNVSNGTQVSLYDYTSGVETILSGSSGTITVTPPSSRTYGLYLRGACGTIFRDIAITVNQPPVISSFTASASPVCAGATSTLSWSASGGTSATISAPGLPGSPVSVNPNSGTLNVNPGSTTTYTLTVTNAAGSVTSQVTVTVTSAATVTSFTASSTTLNPGQSVTFSYSVSGPHNYITIQDMTSGVEAIVPSPSGTYTVTPASTRSYRILINTNCGLVIGPAILITVNQPSVLIGPAGQPGAVGATGTYDDYTNMTQLTGVAVPFGGVTTSGGQIVFTNTVRNGGAADDLVYIQTGNPPSGWSIEVSTNNGASYVNLGGTNIRLNVPASSNVNILIRVTLPAGVPVLTSRAFVIRVNSGFDINFYNDTLNIVWTGFVRADKSVVVTNDTGIGGATDPVRGARIEYVINYSNVTPAPTGTGNVNLTATNVVLTENGNVAPNNWGSTTNHVAGSASDTRGGTITGDVAGSSLLTDTIPSLAPTQSGVFRFSRRIR